MRCSPEIFVGLRLRRDANETVFVFFELLERALILGALVAAQICKFRYQIREYLAHFFIGGIGELRAEQTKQTPVCVLISFPLSMESQTPLPPTHRRVADRLAENVASVEQVGELIAVRDLARVGLG